MTWKNELGGGGGARFVLLHHVTFCGKSKTVCWGRVRSFTQFLVVLSPALVFLID